jgi:hypothetical protein
MRLVKRPSRNATRLFGIIQMLATILWTGSVEAQDARLISCWPGEGNGEERTGQSHASAKGGVTFVSAAVGQGFQLDGKTGLLLIPESSLLAPGTNSFCLTAWVQTSITSGLQAIYSKYNGGGKIFGASSLGFGVQNGKLTVQIRDRHSKINSPGMFVSGKALVANGKFHHVAMVRDQKARKLLLFVDGRLDTEFALTLEANGAIDNDDPEASPYIIGAVAPDSPDPLSVAYRNRFQGVIDQVSFFVGTLTPEQVLLDARGPRLAMKMLPDGTFEGSLASVPGRFFQIESASQLQNPSNWSAMTNIASTSFSSSFVLPGNLGPHVFLRALEIP